jgi:hypothetical protein
MNETRRDEARAMVVRRLRSAGIPRTALVPEHRGVTTHGYQTVDTPIQVNRDGTLVTTHHHWTAPQDTITGILAAIRTYQRMTVKKSSNTP